LKRTCRDRGSDFMTAYAEVGFRAPASLEPRMYSIRQAM
jgi:hypothetical protein